MAELGNHVCGCYYTAPHPGLGFIYPQRHYLPQVHLESHTTITPLYYTTKLSQTFINPSVRTLPETRYTFPLYDGVAVTAFTCTIDDKVIKGHVEQKEQARQTYDAAVQRGESAGLLESLPFGVFGVTLGNIPVDASVRVDIVYGGELRHDAHIDGLRYMLPTSIAPRYGEYPGELLQPNTATVKGLRITVDLDMQGSAIRKVQSPSTVHPVSLSIGTLSTDSIESTINHSRASVTLVHDTTELGSDFVLQILIDDIASPKAILEKHSTLDRLALMTTFVPKFNLKPIRPEIVFIADQSGSMKGSKNEALVTALKTFIKSLPSGVRFNICAFGTSTRFLWQESKLYSPETAAAAFEFVRYFRADLGGTNLFEPIKATFECRLTDLPLELIVLTDGEIAAEQQLFDFVTQQIHQNNVNARCFVLGLGGDVSHTLVEGLARAGNGVSQFVTTHEIMDYKVVRMLKAALYPHVKDYKLELEYEPVGHDDFDIVERAVDKDSTLPNENNEQKQKTISLFDTSTDMDIEPNQDSAAGTRYAHLPIVTVPQIIQAPHHIPALLPFNRITVHLLLQDAKQVPTSVVLRGTCPDGPLELKIPVLKIDNPENVLNSLAAKRAIQELEEGRGWLIDAREGSQSIKNQYPSRFPEIVEREVVRLGTEYQVANKWCSFVAVQEKDDSQTAQTSAEHTASKESEVTNSGLSDLYHPNVVRQPLQFSAARMHGPQKSSVSGIALQQQQMQQRQPMQMQMQMQSQQQQPQPQLQQQQQRQAQQFAPMNAAYMPPSQAQSNYSEASYFGLNGGTESSMGAKKRRAPSSSGHAEPTLLRRYGGRGGSSSLNQPSFSSHTYRPGSSGFAKVRSETIDYDMDSTSPEQDKPTNIPTNDTLASVRALVNLQNFDGSWDWNDTLDQFFGQPVCSYMKTYFPSGLSATALVVAWLQSKALDHRDLWEMVVEKAVMWIENEKGQTTALERAKSALTGQIGTVH